MPEPSDRVQISTADRRLLSKLFRQTASVAKGVEVSKFRAENETMMSRLDCLESGGFLRRESDKYFVSLVALVQLTMPDARATLRDAKAIYRFLRQHYRQHQAQPVALEAIAEATSIPLERTREALGYMIESPWWASRSDFNAANASVAPSERVLVQKDFSAVVSQLEAWQAERLRSRQSLVGAVAAGAGQIAAGGLGIQTRPTSRARPDWVGLLPTDLRPLLDEVYEAHRRGLRWLTAIGLRGVVETMAVALVGDQRTYAEKLKKLCEVGVISEMDRTMLATVIDVGGAAAHRAHTPKHEDVSLLFDVVERVLHGQFVLSPAAARVQSGTPPRAVFKKP